MLMKKSCGSKEISRVESSLGLVNWHLLNLETPHLYGSRQWYTMKKCTHFQLPKTVRKSKNDHPQMFALEGGLLMPRVEKRYYIVNSKHICCKIRFTYHLQPRWFFVLFCFFETGCQKLSILSDHEITNLALT